MSTSRPSRRQFLSSVGTGVAVVGSSGGIIHSERAEHPPYPEIPQSVLDEHGWVQDDEYREEKEDALWSIRSYEWETLRTRVKGGTGGVVDIPLGGIIAMRIGNNGITRRLGERTIWDGGEFLSPRYARGELEQGIRRTYETYLDRFAVIGFANTGEIDWRLSPILPASLGFYSDLCDEGGQLTTEEFGDVGLTQHYLDYELRNDTANKEKSVDLEEEATLEFHGWVGSWYHDDQIYVVVGIHPNGEGGLCGLTSPHLEQVLSEAVGDDVTYEIEGSLWGRLQTVMGAVE